jgi:hypothetical protein
MKDSNDGGEETEKQERRVIREEDVLLKVYAKKDRETHGREQYGNRLGAVPRKTDALFVVITDTQ